MAAGRESSFQVGRYNLSKNDQPQDQSELAVLGLDGVLRLQDTKTGLDGWIVGCFCRGNQEFWIQVLRLLK
jgi:hypothetical protein